MSTTSPHNRATPTSESIAAAPLDVRATRQIAHNVNNLLAVIGGHTDILLEAVPAESPLRRSLSAIRESTAHAGKLTRTLFEMSRRQAEAVDPADPNQLVETIEADTPRRFSNRIDVSFETPEPLWPVRADGALVKHAVKTIASYAMEAMPYGGDITFRATNADVTPEDPRVHAFVKEGRYVRLDMVCSRRLGRQDWLNDFDPIRERAAKNGVDLAAVFGQIKRTGGYLWIGTDESSRETALTMLWPAL